MSFRTVRTHILSKGQNNGVGGGAGGAHANLPGGGPAPGGESEENFAGRYSHLTSACKSDLFLLQMRRDKLHRVLAQHGSSPAAREFTNNVTLGEAEIQKVLQDNGDVARILSRRKFRDADDAVISLAIAIELEAVVNDKLYELQQVCAGGLRASSSGGGGARGLPKFSLTEPTGSKRRQVRRHSVLVCRGRAKCRYYSLAGGRRPAHILTSHPCVRSAFGSSSCCNGHTLPLT